MSITVSDVKQQVNGWIKNGNIETAFTELEKLISPESDLQTHLIIFQSRLSDLIADKHEGTLTDTNFRSKKVAITAALLAFVKDLEAKDVNLEEHKEEEIRERILVICKESRESYMETFFSQYYFKNVSYHFFTEEKLDLSGIDLVILDYNYLKLKHGEKLPIEERNRLERYLLKIDDSNAYLLYFGKQMPFGLADKYSTKAYFSNSVFSLYARIGEMLDFIKYYQKK